MTRPAVPAQKPDVVITVRLKGRATAAAVSDAVGFDATPVLGALTHEGLVEPVKSFFKITPAGTDAAARTLEAVRAEVGDTKLTAVYESFSATNSAFKATVTDWQLRTVGGVHALNDHSDHRYDEAVLSRLRQIHDEISELLGVFPHSVGRYGRYRDRLTSSLAKLTGGQLEFMASPAVDSYHSVWFELHEELIMLCGLTRAGEAEAGRG
jgi:hypothetical protein